MTPTEEAPSVRSERVVRDYFQDRPGWTVVKLDTGKSRAADFRICDNNDCFLCEVKTIESVRANYPGRPLEYYIEQRRKRREEIEQWRKDNPDRQLILRPGEFEFIFGDEDDFIKKYQNRRRSTEKWFNEFAHAMKEYFASSAVRELPYSLRLDSDDLYAPNLSERTIFFMWLESEILAINTGKISWQWQIQRLQYGQAALYTTFYRIHIPTYENDIKAEYQLTLEGPRISSGFEVNIYSYGGLNLDSITVNVEGALNQLESSSERENDNQIPRLIVLAFESGIGFEWKELSLHITWLLKSHPELSAIAILEWMPDGTPPPPENGFLAWAEFQMKAPWVPRYVVYHNRWIRDVRPLPTHVFNDPRSVQLTPL